MKRIKRLNQYLKHWQKVLNLQDWDLELKLIEFKRADGYPQSGDIKVDSKNKKAIVLITKEETGKDSAVILHELIHLILWDFDHLIEEDLPKNKKDQYFNLLEKTVADLTKILSKNETITQ